jgi:hypothetical protein
MNATTTVAQQDQDGRKLVYRHFTVEVVAYGKVEVDIPAEDGDDDAVVVSQAEYDHEDLDDVEWESVDFHTPVHVPSEDEYEEAGE